MEYNSVLSPLCNVISRKLILLCSSSIVNFKLSLIVLNSFSVLCMFVFVLSYHHLRIYNSCVFEGCNIY
jgi:hypothetical protein